MTRIHRELFPAHAGMNRTAFQPAAGAATVPRTRGDEPWAADREHEKKLCSPHTRG